MAGRPTDYKEEYNQLAYNYALMGATDEQLSEFFDVSKATINNWKKSHTEFLDSIKRGRYQADAQVSEKLFTRAMGYEYTEVRSEGIADPETGKPVGTKITKTVKQMAPDTTAQIFWLKNRQPKIWRDKQHIEHSVGDFESDFMNELMSSLKK